MDIAHEQPWIGQLLLKVAHIALVGRVVAKQQNTKSNGDFFCVTKEHDIVKQEVKAAILNRMVIEIFAKDQTNVAGELLERWEVGCSVGAAKAGVSVDPAARDKLLISLLRAMVLISKTSPLSVIRSRHPGVTVSYSISQNPGKPFETTNVKVSTFPSEHYGWPVVVKDKNPVTLSMRLSVRTSYKPVSQPTPILPISNYVDVPSRSPSNIASNQQPFNPTNQPGSGKYPPTQPYSGKIPAGPASYHPGELHQRTPSGGIIGGGGAHPYGARTGSMHPYGDKGYVGSVPTHTSGYLGSPPPTLTSVASQPGFHAPKFSAATGGPSAGQSPTYTGHYYPSNPHEHTAYPSTSPSLAGRSPPYAVDHDGPYLPPIGSLPANQIEFGTSPADFNRPNVRGRSSSSTSTGISPYRADVSTQRNSSSVLGLPLDMAGPSPTQPSYLPKRVDSWNNFDPSPSSVSPSNPTFGAGYHVPGALPPVSTSIGSYGSPTSPFIASFGDSSQRLRTSASNNQIGTCSQLNPIREMPGSGQSFPTRDLVPPTSHTPLSWGDDNHQGDLAYSAAPLMSLPPELAASVAVLSNLPPLSGLPTVRFQDIRNTYNELARFIEDPMARP